jgi:hypothetical protein
VLCCAVLYVLPPPLPPTALVSASCKALCHLSYVWPGAVLPLVLNRFQAALQTATAMHQVGEIVLVWLEGRG